MGKERLTGIILPWVGVCGGTLDTTVGRMQREYDENLRSNFLSGPTLLAKTHLTVALQSPQMMQPISITHSLWRIQTISGMTISQSYKTSNTLRTTGLSLTAAANYFTDHEGQGIPPLGPLTKCL